VLVDGAVREDFLAEVARAAADVVLGDPFDAATTMGPLNNEPTAAKMDRHIEQALDAGATLVSGRGRLSGYPTNLYYDLAVLDEVTPAMAVAREESFGPILPVISAPDDDELLRIANADPLGLQAAVFTRDLRRAFRFAEGLRVGSVVVNDSTDYFESAQPFGGAAGSRTGWGRVGGLAQLRDMTDLRAAIFSLD
jgi:succinate-semialdehyde dehydrogenase/glutarate-semialdehyde dehydrogenase